MTVPISRVNEMSAGALLERLAQERLALRARSVGTMTLAAAASAAIAIAVGAWLLSNSRWLAMPRGIPLLVWSIGILLAVGAVYWLRKREGDSNSIRSLAAAIEGEQGLRAGSLRGALEVSTQGVFGKRAAQDIASRLPSGRALVPVAREKLSRRLAIVGGVAAVAMALVAFSSRSASDGFAAMTHPVAAWRGLLLPPLGFPGLPKSVPRGMPLTVKIAAQGRTSITLSTRAPGDAWSDTTLLVDAKTGLARIALGPIRAPISLRVADGRAPDAEVTLLIGDRGWVGDVALQANYPEYLARSNETLEAVSPLRVPRGTQLAITATLHGGARDALLTNGNDTIRLVATSDSSQVHGHFTADRDGTWHWLASASTRGDNAGLSNMSPEVPEDFALAVARDGIPQVAILSPRSDTAIGSSGILPLAIQASDDHGVARVMLTVWREPAADVGKMVRGTEPKREQLLVAQPGSPIWGGQGGLPLAERNLEPGDRLHLIATAIDNSPWKQEGQSAELVLRVPSLSEQRTMARTLGDTLAAQAQRLATAEKKLQQSTADASRQRDMKSGGDPKGSQSNGGETKSDGAKSQKGTMSFAAAERAKQVARDQRDLTAKLDSMRSSARELEQRLKDAGALDSALSNRMKEVQKLLRDAMTPEMQKQLQNLDKATERLSGTDAQQSMEQLAAQQQQMREQLEKSAEMLKRAAMEGNMQTLRDEARDLSRAQQQLADKLNGKPDPSNKSAGKPHAGDSDPNQLARRSRDLQKEVEQLAKQLEQAGAKPGAQKTREAEPMVGQAADAMQRAANGVPKNDQNKAQQKDQANNANQQSAKNQQDREKDDAMMKALQAVQAQASKSDDAGKAKSDQSSKEKSGAQKSGGQQQAGQQAGPQSGQSGQQQGGQQSGGQQAGSQQGGQQGGQQQAGNDAQKAADSMDKAAQQLADARDAQVEAWKSDLSQQLDQSINETMQLAKQQASLEQRAKQQGGNAQSMQGEQGAIQQGVKQAAERLEKAGRSSSLLSQRSQKAMADAQKRSEQATQAMGQSQSNSGSQSAQNAMKDATESLNQALSSLVRDREKVNSANSASGFTEMMEQLKQLAQQQGSLNGQMQGLNLLPGGAQGQQAQQQSRVLAKQQRDVARSLQDVSDADATGKTDALAKEAQQVAQAMEQRGAADASIAARQQQLYRRLLDAGRFLEKDERDDEGPREAKTGDLTNARAPTDGVQSGKAANKFTTPTWNDLRGLGPEERRLVLEYFRRLNSKS